MNKKIRLSDYAKREELGTILTYRPIAKKIFQEVVKKISPLVDSDILDCYFTKIDVCDVSFSDEFVINLQKLVQNKTNVILRLLDVSEDVFVNLEAALLLRNQKDKSKINLLAIQDNNYVIIGELEKNLLDTFTFMSERQETTARDIAQNYRIEINSASNRLKKLYDASLSLRKEIIDASGRQHQYYLP